MAEEKPLTIVIATDTYLPNVNGAPMFCYRLATEMHARGHRVHVLAVRGDDGKTFTEIRDEAIVHRLKSHSVPTHEYFRIVAPWEVNRQIDRLLADIKPDVIHAQSHYMIGQRSVGWAKKNKVRSVATNHFMPENLDPFLPFPQWFKRIVAHNSWKDMGKIFGRADAVTTPTPLVAKAMRERAKLMNVLPLSNGIEVGNYELAPGEQIIKNDFPTILFAGRLAVEKNIPELIEAAPLMTQVPDAIIEIVGGGEQRVHLEKIADDLGIRDRVRFLGLVSDEELRQAYLRCDVFCQPGTAELQSLVTLEALSASRPVVLANAMAPPHLVDEGVNGYMFKPGDRQDLADKLDRILALSEDERAKLGQAGHRKVMNHAQRKTMDSFEALYRGEKVSTH